MNPRNTALALSLCCLGLAPLTVASTPQASQLVSMRGTYVMIQRGSERPAFARVGNRLESRNQTLLIPGNNYSLARLSFVGGGQSYAGLVVQAGPDLQQTHYQFPCVVGRGKVTLSWRQGNNRGCEEGIHLSPNRSGAKHYKQSTKQTAPQNMEGIIIQPANDNAVILQARTIGDRKIVDALEGEINLISAAHPQGFTLQPGQRYSLDGSNPTASPQVEPINTAAILNSPELQDFLNPSNWTAPGDTHASGPEQTPPRTPDRQPPTGYPSNTGSNGGLCENYFTTLQRFIQEAQAIAPEIWAFTDNPYAFLNQVNNGQATTLDGAQQDRLRQWAEDFIQELERCQFALPGLPPTTEPENSDSTPNDPPPASLDPDTSPELRPNSSRY